jgi:hypothetical protein
VIASAAVPAVQAGTEAFVRGDLESAQIATMEQMYIATEQALNDLEFRIISQRLGKTPRTSRPRNSGAALSTSTSNAARRR